MSDKDILTALKEDSKRGMKKSLLLAILFWVFYTTVALVAVYCH